ncbi:hypothetical protein SETIT_6G015800v2 [Setaria italica]|uniref:DUF1618 domain-containing protein n=3 Tax=Setaria TaxID=4554 RepID=A0A368RGY0_SETIT|nr:uncharacterized protein LOC101753711 [Setaria italica]XP_034599404.1 uncharacterized protein LOC117860255 [Setaria viridis]RCV29466.1 hypothetical protein SETIT_6G015800v2 [Setaria italica]TKW08207.1 hypothetical protein SEVIR_6G014001v2 [Setaria viridis]TKW08208.1 hypothetical protein SEVIR_6G014001v2 [Setaria viridis]
MAAAAAGDSAVPNWVMLERLAFRRDDPASFREDRRTFASGTTSTGTQFDVSFILAEPPTPSRLYLSWPEGPKQESRGLVMAANRNLVLLRLDSLIDESDPFGEVVHDYFIYIADPSSQWTPLLRRLPPCTEYDDYFERQVTRVLPALAVGLLCHGEDEFAVAHLDIRSRKKKSGSRKKKLPIQAELCVLRSSLSCSDDAKWETKILPIQYQYDDLSSDFLYWSVDGVVPFKNALCFVNYCRGILFCDGVFEDSPKVSYIRLPLDTYIRGADGEARKGMYHGLCVTEGGHRLVFVDVARHDGKSYGPSMPNTGFTLTSRTFKMTGNCTTPWQWNEDAVVTSDELWHANTMESLPHDIVMLPLLSMDKANVAHLSLIDWDGGFSLVSIDLSNMQVMGPVITYLKGKDDTADADIVEEKKGLGAHFIPSEFPKFLDLRKRENHP